MAPTLTYLGTNQATGYTFIQNTFLDFVNNLSAQHITRPLESLTTALTALDQYIFSNQPNNISALPSLHLTAIFLAVWPLAHGAAPKSTAAPRNLGG
jgi:hypothetical protein